MATARWVDERTQRTVTVNLTAFEAEVLACVLDHVGGLGRPRESMTALATKLWQLVRPSASMYFGFARGCSTCGSNRSALHIYDEANRVWYEMEGPSHCPVVAKPGRDPRVIATRMMTLEE